MITKFQAVHLEQAGAPRIGALASDTVLGIPRQFSGFGAPSTSTLLAGNAKYNGLESGYAVNAVISTAGSDYAPGDVLTVVGGVGTALQMTVDAVSPTGGVTEAHVTRVGDYSEYPSGSVATTGGTGTGAQLTVAQPPADLYLDTTDLTAPILYVCYQAGDYSTSLWAVISGGGGSTCEFKIVSITTTDVIGCQKWDGADYTGSTILVAKQREMRCLEMVAEVLDGDSVTYTYADSNHRTEHLGGAGESQVLRPPYRVGDIIMANKVSGGMGGAHVGGVEWIEKEPRMWVKRYA